jgi:hypothetical protein
MSWATLWSRLLEVSTVPALTVTVAYVSKVEFFVLTELLAVTSPRSPLAFWPSRRCHAGPAPTSDPSKAKDGRSKRRMHIRQNLRRIGKTWIIAKTFRAQGISMHRPERAAAYDPPAAADPR